MEIIINNTKVYCKQDNPYGNEWYVHDENYDAEHDGFDWTASGATGTGKTAFSAIIDYLYNLYPDWDDESFNELLNQLDEQIPQDK